MEFELPKSQAWYRRWWGVVLVGAGSIFGIFLVLVAVTTIRYWLQLRRGEAPVFIQGQYSNFTVTANQAIAHKNIADRRELETTDDPYLGRPNASVVVVGFFDYKCPNCRLAAPIIRQAAAKYGYGVKFIIRDFPAETLHPGAGHLARVANCAEQQGRFWEMFDALFVEQDALPENPSNDDLKRLSLLAGVDYTALLACYQSSALEQEIRQDYVSGAQFGVAGTPTFFVNGERIEGVVPLEAWEKYFQSVLK